MKKICIRCKNEFEANPIIQNDDVCRTCETMNCITFWYPKLQRLGFPMPKTEIIYTDVKLVALLDGEKPEGIDKFIDKIEEAISKVGSPSFIRTGYLSNKHDWEKSCFLKKGITRREIISHITNIVEMSSITTIDRMTPIDFWAIREFIETEPYFNYFPGKMPITKERRYFINNGNIQCHHNYWDRKAFGNDIDKNKFEKLASLSEEDEKILEKMASYIANMFSGYWSVDFLKGKNGQWYMTDMAIGERSYHPEHK